jgi:TonB-dependent SusC/RagA subfamily outer membrane receptor
MKKRLLLLLPVFFLLALTGQAREKDTLQAICPDSAGKISCGTTYKTVYYRTRLNDMAPYVLTRCLEGQVPGLGVANGNGQPGAPPELVLRGASDLQGSNEPLLVVNGAIYPGNIASLDIRDITSVTVLKDAMATIAYGNRGANGVLEIVTRQKTDGSSRLNLNVRSGIVTRAIRDYDKLGAKDFYEMMLYATNRHSPTNVIEYLGGYNAYDVPDNELFTPDGRINPNASLKYEEDWQKAIQRIGFRHDYHLSASGNGKRGAYYLSAGYLNENGYVKGTSFERANITFNGSLKVRSWLKAGLIATGTLGTQHFATSGNRDILDIARFMPFIYPVYMLDNNGQQITDPATGEARFDWGFVPGKLRPYGTGINTLGILEKDKQLNRLPSFLVNPYMEVSFLKQFTLHTGFHYNYDLNKQTLDFKPDYVSGTNPGRLLTLTREALKTYTARQSLTWKPFFDKHHIEAKAGWEIYRSRQDYQLTATRADTINVNEVSSSHQDNVEGYYANGLYNYDERYFLSAGLRRDATNRLSPSSRWNNYWACGVGYQISNEAFLRNVPWLNILKLRMNYGTQGNSGISSSLQELKFKHLNAGLDFAAFRSRLSLTLDAYSRDNDAVLGRNNYMTVNNKGIEMSLSADLISKSNTGWAVRLIAAHNKNSVTMPENFPVLFQSNYRLTTGSSLYDFYLPQYMGPDRATGLATYYFTDASGRPGITTDYQSLTENDKAMMGSASPDFHGSFTNTIRIMQFSISLQLNYGIGGKYYDQVYASLMSNGLERQNWSTDILDHWTPANPSSDIPRADIYDPYTNAISSRFIRDASYLNIKHVYIGYHLRAGKLKKMKLQSLTVYLTAENLWLFTATKGMNPQSTFKGVDTWSYMPARTILLGINAGI